MFPYVTSLILDGKGRIVIPARVRESLGLKPGDIVKLEFLGNEITLSVKENGENEIQDKNALSGEKIRQ